MFPSDHSAVSPWASLPDADPPARLRAAVLRDWQRAHGPHFGRLAAAVAGFAVAALFVLAVALPMRVGPPDRVDPALALLRAQGLEVAAPPTAAKPAEVRHVANGSSAARLGLRPGDQLLSVELPVSANGMLNVAVLRGASQQYFALPAITRRASEPDAGMASARERPDTAKRITAATPLPVTTSFLQSLI